MWSTIVEYGGKSKDRIVDAEPDYLLAYVPVWPLIVQLMSGVFCMGCSSFYHLFYVKNEFLKNLLSRLDYSGIIILIMGSSIPPHYYPFACQNTHKERNIFMTIIFSASMTTFFAILTPVFQKRKWKPLLTGLFIILGLSAALPLYYICIFVSDKTGYSKDY